MRQFLLPPILSAAVLCLAAGAAGAAEKKSAAPAGEPAVYEMYAERFGDDGLHTRILTRFEVRPGAGDAPAAARLSPPRLRRISWLWRCNPAMPKPCPRARRGPPCCGRGPIGKRSDWKVPFLRRAHAMRCPV